MFEKHPHWPHVLNVCKTLKSKGYTAWLAGGCVRDGILNRIPQDFDVVTNATPDVVQNLFPVSLDIGKSFGIIIVPIENKIKIEIATFRNDGQYEDGRRPSNVTYSTPQEDAQRRDFTINAMFYDPFLNQIHDFVDGKKDLDLKLLRAVGNPEKRFSEDKLRMLRAIRFSSQLDFQIEEKTYLAIQNMSSQILQISQERIFYEFSRIFQTQNSAQGIYLLNDSGLLKEILKEKFDVQKIQNLIDLMKKVETSCEELKWILFWKCILNFNKNKIQDDLKDFKHSKDFILRFNYVTSALIKILNHEIKKGELYPIAFSPEFEIIMDLARVLYTEQEYEIFKNVEKLKCDYTELPKPLVRGEDLIKLGVQPSQKMKEFLSNAYNYQLENRILDKNEMLVWTKNQIT